MQWMILCHDVASAATAREILMALVSRARTVYTAMAASFCERPLHTPGTTRLDTLPRVSLVFPVVSSLIHSSTLLVSDNACCVLLESLSVVASP